MAKLRKVQYFDPASGAAYEVWFHCFTNKGTAVIEDQAGNVREVGVSEIRFSDRPALGSFGSERASIQSSGTHVPGLPSVADRRRLTGRR